jgi:ABC-type glycerol-3-phosphate transport system substrate-binding protein
MKIKHKPTAFAKLGIGLTALTLLLAGCSGGGSSSSDNGGTVTGVSTPSKVSVVNTN